MCGVKDVYRQTKKISDLREKMEKYLKYLKERKGSFLRVFYYNPLFVMRFVEDIIG